MIAESEQTKKKHWTQDALATALSRTRRTIAEYQARGMPQGCTPSEARAWIALNVGVRHLRDEELSSASKQLELEKLAEEVRAKRLKNDMTAGRLVYLDEIKLSVSETFARVKARLDDMPDIVAREVAPAERRRLTDIVRHAVDLVCREIARDAG